MKMLEREGFSYDCYIDIFDGGPTMSATLEEVRTFREAQQLVLAEVSEEMDGHDRMLAAGRLGDFAACCGHVRLSGENEATLDSGSARMLGLKPGDSFLAMSR